MTNLKVKIVTRITHRDELRTWDPATDEHHPAPLSTAKLFSPQRTLLLEQNVDYPQ